MVAIKTLFVCLAFALAGVQGAARAQDIKFGVLTDLGGPYADSSGLGAVEATRMAIEDLKDSCSARGGSR